MLRPFLIYILERLVECYKTYEEVKGKEEKQQGSEAIQSSPTSVPLPPKKEKKST